MLRKVPVGGKRRAKIVAIGVLSWVAAVGWIQPTSAQQCEDADPSRTTAEVYGDFEFTADPDDPIQHLIYLNHVDNGPSSIVVARMNGVTGIIEPGTLTTVADNFQGQRHINGPEFVRPPGLGLGILYRALDGVHAVFRPNRQVPDWNNFHFDINGAPATRSPPVLASSLSLKGSYETGGLPFGQNTYALFDGPCTLRCFASMRSGVPTDPEVVLEQNTRLTIPSIESVVQSPKDGTIDFEACTRNDASICGLFEAAINGAGGFERDSFQLLTSLPPRVGLAPERVPLAVQRHPATGTNVIFVQITQSTGEAISIYEQRTAGSTPTLIATVPSGHTDHYRVIDSPTELVLHFLVRSGDDKGSFELPVKASPDKQLQVGQIKKIADAAGGAEVEYLPAAGRFAIWFQTSTRPSIIQRCFFDP